MLRTPMSPRKQTQIAQSGPGFTEQYGPWALIAGASEGLGAAYADALARRGLNLVLVARRRALLDELAEGLRGAHGVEVFALDGDLGERHFLESLHDACSALEVGLVVYNAAHAPIGEFVATPLDDLLRVAAVNIRAPVALVRGLLPGMTERGRGGVILMTSLAGNQGSPYIATYAASKAFNRVLAEGLWYELKDKGVDVVACCAGAVRTPGYGAAAGGKDAPGTLHPQDVVEQALRALGWGPVVIPGRVNRVASAFMTRVLPRRTAISIMAGNTVDLKEAP
jgi:short-subunit dehydrogenase